MAEIPSKRGYRQVLISEEAYNALVGYRDRNGLSSMGAAILLALSEAQKPDPTPFDVEAAILFCRLDGKTSERLRFYAESGGK